MVETQQDRLYGFRDDPCGFVRDVLGADIWSKQAEILRAVRDHDRIAVRSCNGSGKTFLAAHAVLWWVATRPEGVVVTTAPTLRQVQSLLWREIRGAYHRSEGAIGGDISKAALELGPRNFALGIATDRAERFQGFHAGEILFVVDEASGVSEEIFDAIRGSMTSRNAKLLLIGNPTKLYGTFYDAFHGQYRHWHTIHISAFDCISASGKSELAASRLVTASWAADMAAMLGKESAEYQIRVLGQFPSAADDALISVSSIERAIARWQDDGGSETQSEAPSSNWFDSEDAAAQVIVGLDVARFGNDRSVACARRDGRVLEIEAWKGADVMRTSGRVLEFAKRNDASIIVVDESGVGGGVLDRLREVDEVESFGINVGRAAGNRERYANLRAELFDGLRSRFDQDDIAIPNDKELVAELSAIRYFFTSRGQLQLEDKRKYSGRSGSPDKADALMLAFSEHAVHGEVGMYLLERVQL